MNTSVARGGVVDMLRFCRGEQPSGPAGRTTERSGRANNRTVRTREQPNGPDARTTERSGRAKNLSNRLARPLPRVSGVPSAPRTEAVLEHVLDAGVKRVQ